MDASALVALLRTKREKWIEVEPAAGDKPAKELRVIRPPEVEFGKFGAGATIEIACDYVNGWRGITEADLIGASGAGDPLDFDSALWREVARDRVAWLVKAAAAIGEAVTDHLKRSDALEKNSPPS